MTITCSGTDITAYLAHGYQYELEPQYGGSVTTIDGLDHSAKIRDRVKLTLPFIPLTKSQLTTVLQLFPASGAYVDVSYYDLFTGATRSVSMKYDTRSSTLAVSHAGGNEYYDGLVVTLTER